MAPVITKLKDIEFEYPLTDMGRDVASGKLYYEPGTIHHRSTHALKIHTDAGVTGAYISLDAVSDFGTFGVPDAPGSGSPMTEGTFGRTRRRVPPTSNERS